MENLTVVIPFRNGHNTIEALLERLPPTLPVIVVDDQSERPYASQRPNVTVIRPETRGYFSGAVNVGLSACATDVLVLNQDVVSEGSEWLNLLAEKRSNFAVIGDGVFNHPAWPLGYVQGTFMFMRRDALAAVGGFNADEYPLWGSTCEWQLRACRQGFLALPLSEIPGFSHARRGSFGTSIQAALREEPDKKGLFVQTPPKVSVIVNCYNYGRYLADAVHSLIGGETDLGRMGQTYHSFEVIIVNDASQDETREVGQALADGWKGVRYIEMPPSGHPDGLPNNGTPAANNAGIREAYGRYVTILCADDMMEPWRLEHFVRAQESNPHSLVFDNTTEFAHGRRTGTRPYGPYNFETLLVKNFIHAGIMFPKSAWEEVGGYPEAMRYGREDWAMNVRLGQYGYCGEWLNEGGYLYRREGQGRSERNTNPRWREQFREQMYNLFPRLYRGERPMACCGSKNNNGNGASATVVAQSQRNVVMVGQEGMEILEYTGTNRGTQLWAGLVTGTDYVFGGDRKRGYVDARDARGANGTKGMPELYGVFRIVQPDDITEKDAELDVPPSTAKLINPTAPKPSSNEEETPLAPGAGTEFGNAHNEEPSSNKEETPLARTELISKILEMNLTDGRNALIENELTEAELLLVLAGETTKETPRKGMLSAIDQAIANLHGAEAAAVV